MLAERVAKSGGARAAPQALSPAASDACGFRAESPTSDKVTRPAATHHGKKGPLPRFQPHGDPLTRIKDFRLNPKTNCAPELSHQLR